MTESPITTHAEALADSLRGKVSSDFTPEEREALGRCLQTLMTTVKPVFDKFFVKDSDKQEAVIQDAGL